MSEESDIIQALQVMMETQVSEVNTTLPGTIVSYDAASRRAVVQITQPKMLADGTPLEAPKVASVPVVWPTGAGGQAGLTIPLKAGDGLMLNFAQRSLEGWLSGSDDAPDDPRQHDISDAVAVPGLAASGVSANPNDLELHFGPVKLRLKPDGGAVLETAGGNLTISADGVAAFTGPRVTVQGDVVVQGDVTAGTISLRNHVHTGVQPGGGFSGVPRP